MKKLCISLLALMLSMTTFAQFSGSGSGTSSDPYLIFNPIQLDQVRNFLGNSDVYFKMMADIDLEEYIADNYPTQGWLPIGTASSRFQGQFNGNGKKITNLMINRSSTDNVGFFGATGRYVSISNLTIEGNVNGKEYVGGIVGHAQSGVTITNCSTNVTLSGTNNVGGIVGYAQSTSYAAVTITNCSTNVTLSGTNYVGGIIGYVYRGTSVSKENIANCTVQASINGTDYVGGVVGGFSDYSLDNSMNTIQNSFVTITINGHQYLGGLVGRGTVKITRSAAIVEIHATGDFCGGLVGVATCYSNTHSSNISNCHVSGNIAANNSIGGLVGLLSGYAYSGYYAISTISDSHFHGTIVGNENVGGVCGYNDKYGEVRTTYSAATISGVNNVGGIIGNTGGSSVIQQNVAINNSVSGNTNVGRIIGLTSGGNYGEIGTANTNKAMNSTKVSLNGIEQTCEDNAQHGQSVGKSVLKYKATYQGIGWDFTNTWDQQETESYPYFTWQVAPPILNSATSGATTVSGKGTNDAVIRVMIGVKNYQTTCNNNEWSITTEPLVPGSIIFALAGEGLSTSYLVSTTVSYKGKGTESDPYQVYTAQELANINGNGYYKLMNDINVSSINPWKPIGQNEAVTAHLDGDNHTVSGLNVNTTTNYQGLFGQCDGSILKNINLSVTKLQGGDYTGALVAKIIGGEIINCHITGDVKGGTYTGGLAGMAQTTPVSQCTVNGNVTGGNYTGGLAGSTQTSAISQCAVEGNVTGTTNVGGISSSVSAPVEKTKYNGSVAGTETSAVVGGLAGVNSSSVSECMTSGSVSCSQTSSIVGGLVGQNTSEGIIVNCNSEANVIAAQDAGGLVGRNFGAVEKCYASGNVTSTNVAAGVVGYNDGSKATVKYCFAMNPTINVSSSSGVAIRAIGGIANSAPVPDMNNYALKTMAVSVNGESQKIYDDILNGVSKTETELKQNATYSNSSWDMSAIWGIDNQSYPYLRCFAQAAPSTATITFVNYDGSELQSGEVTIGEVPLYNGATPVKPSDAQYSYTFTGWNPEIVAVTGDAIYTATFQGTLNKYVITFKNEDGTELQSGEVNYGETPVYSGAVPTKTADAQYTYTFKGWAPALAAVTEAATYTATFEGTPQKYLVTFKNEDGTELKSGEVNYGETPVYSGAVPTKTADAQYTYTFKAWSPEIVAVTGEATYIATFEGTLNKYLITFKNEDGTVLQSEEVNYGVVPDYNGATPAKEADAMYTYTFKDWIPAVTAVTGEATYIASFTGTPIATSCPFSGTCGAGTDNVTWELSCDGVLTISGTGSMEYYCGGFPPEPHSAGLHRRKIPGVDAKPTPWALYVSQIKELRIEEGITGIGSCAFADLALTGEVTIPSSVIAIGDDAFAGCSSISKIIFTGATPIIGYDCFEGCNCTFAVPCGSKADYVQALEVDENRVIEPEPEFTYSIASSNTEQGSVSITKEPTCADLTIEFSAEAVDGFVFKKWSDDVTTNPRTLVLTQDTILTALFEKVETTIIIHDGEDEDLDDVIPSNPTIIVEPGGDLNVDIWDVRIGVITVISTGSQSGEIHGADNLSNNWRIFLEYRLNPLGFEASPDLWYAFAVPFEVDIETGITRAYGNPSHVSGVDFLILEYDGQARAQTTRGWKKKLTGTLQPGTFYMIGIAGNCNRWLFEKKSDASMQGDDQINIHKYFASNSDNNKHNGWNGIGNTKLEYAGIDFNGCEINYLIMFDNKINDYITTLSSAAGELCVGQPFFVQAPNLDGMSINFSASAPNPMPALMARKADTPLMHLTLSDQQVTYPMYVTMHEDASYTYTIGRDVMRMDGGNTLIPKCWIVSGDGTELSAHGIALPETETIVPIGIYAPKDGEYLFELNPRAMDEYDVELLHNNAYVATLFEGMQLKLDLEAGTSNDYSLRIRRKQPTDISNVQSSNEQSTKLLINDHLYILRGEHVYDAQGKALK